MMAKDVVTKEAAAAEAVQVIQANIQNLEQQIAVQEIRLETLLDVEKQIQQMRFQLHALQGAKQSLEQTLAQLVGPTPQVEK